MIRARSAPYEAVFDELGVLVENAAMTAKNHMRFLVELNGVKRIFIAPGSCSDHRGLTQFRGDVRRWAREVGAAQQPEVS